MHLHHSRCFTLTPKFRLISVSGSEARNEIPELSIRLCLHFYVTPIRARTNNHSSGNIEKEPSTTKPEGKDSIDWERGRDCVSIDLSVEDSMDECLKRERVLLAFSPTSDHRWVQGLQFVMDLQGPDPHYSPVGNEGQAF
jgi:hypothetical protein